MELSELKSIVIEQLQKELLLAKNDADKAKTTEAIQFVNSKIANDAIIRQIAKQMNLKLTRTKDTTILLSNDDKNNLTTVFKQFSSKLEKDVTYKMILTISNNEVLITESIKKQTEKTESATIKKGISCWEYEGELYTTTEFMKLVYGRDTSLPNIYTNLWCNGVQLFNRTNFEAMVVDGDELEYKKTKEQIFILKYNSEYVINAGDDDVN